MNNFTFDYCKVLTEAIGADYADNYDAGRFGPLPVKPKSLKSKLADVLSVVGLSSEGSKAMVAKQARDTVARGLDFVEPHLVDLEWLYGELADDESRNLLVKLAAYRALRHRKIKLPINTPEYWTVREKAAGLPRGSEEIDVGFLGWKLQEVNLDYFGYPIKLFANRGANVTTFVHQQYRCETADGPIECAEGDMVVDAGGCYGDTALYFAHKAGQRGKVASFEFLPVNVSVFSRNLALNPELASRIRLYENPVYSTSGQELFVIGNGPGTRVVPESDNAGARKAQTMKIDDLVASGDFRRIDFIKMDIEGAELEALKGSESILRQFKPKLAITVYHDFEDFWEIPQFLDRLGLGYRFYLRHFTIHAEETVLFAVAK